MTDKNLLLQDDAFAPPVGDTLEHLPTYHLPAGHSPAQPDEALKARNIELAQRLEWARQDLIKQADKIDKLEARIAAQAGQEPILWTECERISDLPTVAEALENFSMDATADNAICLVREILTYTPPQSILDGIIK